MSVKTPMIMTTKGYSLTIVIEMTVLLGYKMLNREWWGESGEARSTSAKLQD